MVMALRINSLASGYSGISSETLNKLIEAFNKDIIPYIPEYCTGGTGGDSMALAHLIQSLMGEGKVWDALANKFEESKIVLARCK